MRMTYADIYREAAKLIENGWCKGHYTKRIGNKQYYCVAGAIEEVGNKVGSKWNHFGTCAFDRANAQLERIKSVNLIRFNDMQKSKRPVIEFLNRMAELPESQEEC
jgi:hypothetical protein